jgi:hypothetical protein
MNGLNCRQLNVFKKAKDGDSLEHANGSLTTFFTEMFPTGVRLSGQKDK